MAQSPSCRYGSSISILGHKALERRTILESLAKPVLARSVLAKMILLAYARYPKMALLVIDPQGEFAKKLARGDTVQVNFGCR